MIAFGNIQGPFAANEEVFTKIEEQCQTPIEYITKLGIQYVGGFNLDLKGEYWEKIFVTINDIEFQIGTTRMLELEDVKITSIKFPYGANNKIYIDYQYNSLD